MSKKHKRRKKKKETDFLNRKTTYRIKFFDASTKEPNRLTGCRYRFTLVVFILGVKCLFLNYFDSLDGVQIGVAKLVLFLHDIHLALECFYGLCALYLARNGDFELMV